MPSSSRAVRARNEANISLALESQKMPALSTKSVVRSFGPNDTTVIRVFIKGKFLNTKNRDAFLVQSCNKGMRLYRLLRTVLSKVRHAAPTGLKTLNFLISSCMKIKAGEIEKLANRGRKCFYATEQILNNSSEKTAKLLPTR